MRQRKGDIRKIDDKEVYGEMKYRQTHYLSKDANTCVADILRARGVENIEAYMRPSQEYENDSMLLDHIEEAAGRLIWHLNQNSSILFVVDCD